jgi:hypothetical protein
MGCGNKAEMQPGGKQAYVVLNQMNSEGPAQPKRFEGATGRERIGQGVYCSGRRQAGNPARMQSAFLTCTQCSNYKNTSRGKATIFVR